MILYNAPKMHGNLEQTNMLALSLEQHQLQQQQQQQQQQQHSSFTGSEHPLHSPTTPAEASASWSSVAHIKNEPLDNKDDSGISPGHFASDTATSESLQLSLGSAMSPESSRSLDSTSPPIADYSMQSVDENFVSSSRSLYSDCEISPVLLKCPICGLQYHNRLEFTDHLRGHCPSAAKISKEEFNKCVMAQLTSSNTSTNRSNEEKHYENFERGIRIPCISSQGKVTTHHCKQCGAVFITKVDKWIHGRSHMRPEKILDCPRCEFSTELKHHLEYHLLNHMGSKPYKCEKCDYECVNKSMLNSHMKSHSNVYQFRCANCSYVAKYCHSLKMHLRKYDHESATVLNPDGTPNPDYKIDVYGTRRGPKSKSKAKTQKVKSENTPQFELTQPPVPILPSPSTGFNQSYQFNPMNGLANMANFNAFGEANAFPRAFINFPLNQIFSHLPIANLYATNAANAINQNTAHTANEAQNYCTQGQTSPSYMDYSRGGTPTSAANESHVTAKNEEAEVEDDRSTPLNLTTNCGPEEARQTDVARHAEAPHNTQVARHSEVASPKTTGTSRRKGLARRILKNDSDKVMPKEDLSDSPPTPPLSPPDSSDSEHKSKSSNDYTCQHCNISFGHEIMHLVHMNYHDRQNPFKCSKCGTQTYDSVSFFIHIVDYKH